MTAIPATRQEAIPARSCLSEAARSIESRAWRRWIAAAVGARQPATPPPAGRSDSRLPPARGTSATPSTTRESPVRTTRRRSPDRIRRHAALAGSPAWLTVRAPAWLRRLPVTRRETISVYSCSSELARAIYSRARMSRIVGAAPRLGRSCSRRRRDFDQPPEQLPDRAGTLVVRARSQRAKRKWLRPTRSTSTLQKRGGVRSNRPVEVRWLARHCCSVGPRHRRPTRARRECRASPWSMPGPSVVDPPAATPVRGRWRPATGGPRPRCGSPEACNRRRAPGPGRSTAARRSARDTKPRPGRRCR